MASSRPVSAGRRDPQALISTAQDKDADLRNHPERLKFRHHIERVIGRWSRAVRASRGHPELERQALQGQAAAWALMAHWSGRSDDLREAQRLRQSLAARPVPATQDAPLAPFGEPSVFAGEEATAPEAPAPVVAEASAPVVAEAPAPVVAEALPSEHAPMDAETLAEALRDTLEQVGSDPAEAPLVLRSSTRAAALPRATSLVAIRRVIIDAGHGGTDDGAVGPGGEREADVNLAIAKRLGHELSSKHGLEIIYTRTDDQFISLQRRTQIANRTQADLFISVHANAHRNRRVHGIETYYLNTTTNRYAQRLARRENLLADDGVDAGLEPDTGMDDDDLASLPDGELGQDLKLILADLAMRSASAESRRLAGYIQTSAIGRLQRQQPNVKDLGVKHALFYVLLGARMPAVLVETGFISHAEESQRLINGAYQQHLAEAIARGVMRFAEERDEVAQRLHGPRVPALEGGAIAARGPTLAAQP